MTRAGRCSSDVTGVRTFASDQKSATVHKLRIPENNLQQEIRGKAVLGNKRGAKMCIAKKHYAEQVDGSVNGIARL